MSASHKGASFGIDGKFEMFDQTRMANADFNDGRRI
jgi:hypothetical protein